MDRTSQQVAGDAAKELVAARLVGLGWQVLGRNVHAGRSELDIVAVDPGPPARLVIVEVRWRRSRSFGLPEETFDYRKRAHLRAGVGRLLETGRLPSGDELPRLPIALDLAVVEPGVPEPVVRFHRDALS
jgi:Holliday junction resolvase-like predicted endonuclease